MNLSDWIPVKGVWMFPFWFGGFVFGLMLLAPDTMPTAMQRWTLPSLAVYLVGVGNVIFWKELHHRRYRNRVDNGGVLPTGPLLFYVALHVLLFGGFVWYNWCKGVI